MSVAAASIPIPPEVLKPALRARLFPEDDGLLTYAILDGSSIPDLLAHLHDDKPEFACLYRGELEPDMAVVAPYLVRLKDGAPFAEWVLAEGWGRHWGIFMQARSDLTKLRQHFRQFLRVKDPEGNPLYFRFYDPRVLRLYLPTCNEEELAFVFGPLRVYVCEGPVISELLAFLFDGQQLKAAKTALLPPEASVR